MRTRFLLLASLPLSALACAAAPTEPAAAPQAAVVDLRSPPPPAEDTSKASAPDAEATPSDEEGEEGEELTEFGMIGLLNTGDPDEQLGGLWGDSIGDSFGAGGLGLSGSVGGGTGVGSIGGLGSGSGVGSLGTGRGRAAPPKVRMGATDVKGRLPPEIIQRIVRQSFGRFRLCYEVGLQKNPSLEGKVSVRFVIAKNGSVAAVEDAGSTMPDKAVKACVMKAFQGLLYPAPEGGGVVVVVYPIVFKPGDTAKPAAPAKAP